MSYDYKDAGVDIDAGEQAVAAYAPLAATTLDANVLGGLGGFAAAYRLPTVQNPTLLAATDGVGTKLLLALQENKHDTIGIDLVAMVANDLVADGAKPLFFLDYMAVDKLDPAHAAKVVGGIAEGCRQAGMALIGGETAEMPGMYPKHHYDLAGFAVGLADEKRLLPRNVAAGDVLLGLPSSGVHSNGFSLVRRILAETELGVRPLADGRTVTDALLAPTRIYVAAVLPLITADLVHGIAHITGGGFTDNVPRMLPDTLAARFDASKWELPELFARIQDAGALGDAVMRRTFNLGMGMVLAVTQANVRAVLTQIPDATIIGSVVDRTPGADSVQWED